MEGIITMTMKILVLLMLYLVKIMIINQLLNTFFMEINTWIILRILIINSLTIMDSRRNFIRTSKNSKEWRNYWKTKDRETKTLYPKLEHPIHEIKQQKYERRKNLTKTMDLLWSKTRLGISLSILSNVQQVLWRVLVEISTYAQQ